MNYKLFTVEDLVLNDSFQSFVYKSDDKSVLFWLNWIKENPENKHLVDEASYVLRALLAEKHQLSEIEIKVESDKIKHILKENNPNGKRISLQPTYNWKLLTGIAASILLFLSIGLFQLFNFKTEEIAYIVKETKKGQKILIQLTDGSTINLNSESSVKYSANFDGDIREVYLEGEGFFNVTKNKNKPFVVYADNITTTVLGTSFNVSAYKDDNEIIIALVTGKVLVEDTENHKVLLTPDLMVSYDKKTKNGFKKSTFDFNKVIGWKNGILSFNEATLAQVFTNLERWYDINITVDKKVDLEGKYTGSFQNEPLKNILDAFSIVENYEYKIVGKNVSITKK